MLANSQAAVCLCALEDTQKIPNTFVHRVMLSVHSTAWPALCFNTTENL